MEPKLTKSELLALDLLIEQMKENKETTMGFIGSIGNAFASIGRAVAAGAGAAVGEALAVGTGVANAATNVGAAVGNAANSVGSAVTEVAATSELASVAADAAEAAAMTLGKTESEQRLQPLVNVLKNTNLMNAQFTLKELEDLRTKLTKS